MSRFQYNTHCCSSASAPLACQPIMHAGAVRCTCLSPRLPASSDMSAEPSWQRRPVAMRTLGESSPPMGAASTEEPGRRASIFVSGVEYDVSNFNHPGGEVINHALGKDATEVFSAFHGGDGWMVLRSLPVLSRGSAPTTCELYKELLAKLTSAGLMKASPAFYVYKFFTTVALLPAAYALLALGWFVPAVLAMSFFFQQAAWLSHDFCHHQVFKQTWKNNLVGGYFLGSLLQGYSMAWWKWQHNTHHAVTNEMDKDPDITTMPLIAWDEEQINAVGPGILMRHQAFLIPVYTAFARIAWLADSFFGHPSQPRRPLKIDLLERSLILAHYAAAMWAAAACAGSVKAGLAFFFASQIIAGWLISSVFIVSHNPMEILKPAAMEGTSFLKAQCLSTCNIKPSPLVDWFTGGLSYQIEHHLFPRMPRHNFAAASKIVSSFCKQHGIPYVTFTFPGALAAVVSVLYRVQTYANRRHAKLRQAA